jgi:protein-S-isoprenylcysteine O-methyltransferase
VVPQSESATAAALTLTYAGLAIAVWARFCIGRNWSAIVELKQGHTLVRRGPYRVVRHPIYSGLLLAMVGTAIGCGELGALLGVAVGLAGWLAKARMEESFLLTRFPKEYGEYRRNVRTLIPFVL